MSPQATDCSTTTGKPESKSSAIGQLQFLEIVERFIRRADLGAGHASLVVELAKEHQLVEIGRTFQFALDSMAKRTGSIFVRMHVVFDEEAGALRDQAV